MTGPPAARIMLVTDRTRVAPAARTTSDQLAALVGQLEAAIEAGVDLIQLRERDLDASRLRDLAATIVARAAGRTAVVVNDRADVAITAGAAGVHLRSDGPPAARVRSGLPFGLQVGRSIHAADPVGAGRDADWIVFGPVFETESKPGAVAVGLEALRARVGDAPVFAIGGVTPARARACARAGAAGVAGIGLFLPSAAARHAAGLAGIVSDLRMALESGLGDG